VISPGEEIFTHFIGVIRLMRLSARLTLAASCATIALTAACSDSTGPTAAQQAARLAAHFDTLYVQANAKGDSGSNGYYNRAQVMTILEIPTAFGALPSTVTVTTAAGVEHWKGFELEEVIMNGGTPSDSSYVVVAYRESDAHTAFVGFYGSDGSIQDGGLIVNDTLAMNPVTGSSTTSLTSVSGACTTPATTLINPAVTTFAPSTCASAKFTTSMAASFSSSPDIDPALTNVSFTATSFDGERFVEEGASGQSRVRRVREMLQRLHNANRL
jgi:hypothetical protein